ncbi:MAG: helix-turn-helix domain-containing protein [Filifactoraceae bacterium]
MLLSQAIAERIIQLCSQYGITINKLANISGLTQSTIDSVLKGKTKHPTVHTIQKICLGLDIELHQFFESDLFNDIDHDI